MFTEQLLWDSYCLLVHTSSHLVQWTEKNQSSFLVISILELWWEIYGMLVLTVTVFYQKFWGNLWAQKSTLSCHSQWNIWRYLWNKTVYFLQEILCCSLSKPKDEELAEITRRPVKIASWMILGHLKYNE